VNQGDYWSGVGLGFGRLSIIHAHPEVCLLHSTSMRLVFVQCHQVWCCRRLLANEILISGVARLGSKPVPNLGAFRHEHPMREKLLAIGGGDSSETRTIWQELALSDIKGMQGVEETFCDTVVKLGDDRQVWSLSVAADSLFGSAVVGKPFSEVVVLEGN